MDNLNKNILSRLVGSFLSRLSNYAIWPFLAIYLNNNLGAVITSNILIGSVIITVFINFIGGYICDISNRKKLLNILSLTEFISLIFLSLSIHIDHIYIFISIFYIYLIPSTLKRPVLSAIIQDAVNKNNREFIYRIDYWLYNLSLTLGFSIGGIFYQNYQLHLFIFSTILSFITFIIYYKFLEDSKTISYKGKQSNFILSIYHSYKEVIINKPYTNLVIGSSLVLYGELILGTYIAVKLSKNFNEITIFDYKIDGISMFSIINITNTLIVLLLTMFVVKLINKLGSFKSIIIGLTLYTLGYSFLTVSNSFSILIFAIILASIGELIYSPIKNSKQLDLIPSNKRGTYSTFSSLGFYFAEILSKFAIVGSNINSIYMGSITFILLTIGSILIVLSLFYVSKTPNS